MILIHIGEFVVFSIATSFLKLSERKLILVLIIESKNDRLLK